MKPPTMIPAYKCERCGHLTVTRDGRPPKACGGCKSLAWATPKRAGKK